MSPRAEAYPPEVRARKPSSSRPTAIRRLQASWTRWRLSRMRRRQERLRAKLAPVLAPILQEALEQLAHPMVLAMGRLDDRQLEIQQRLWQVPTEPVQVEQPMAELRELMEEILASLQPPAEQTLALQLGLPVPPISYPSSGS